jgi:MerR family transcriptional regulator, repressor of the yfmOP operon
MTEQEQLTRILTLVELTNSRLDKLDQDIQIASQRIQTEAKNASDRLETEVKRWDDRFFQLVKEQGQTDRTIIIAAASVVVLSPVLGAVTDFASKFLSR